MRIGEVFRYSRPYSPEAQYIDGLPNYFSHTNIPGANLPLLEKGINPIARIRDCEGHFRTPAILISSSPHKAGSFDTPWEDTFDPDNGHVRYYGDNKDPQRNPSLALGNRALIEAYRSQASSCHQERRFFGVPILLFRRVPYSGRIKGNVMFQGYGVIESIELITQFDSRHERYFTNYVFDFCVFGLANENEVFPWQWIVDRRNHALAAEATLARAPSSWMEWIKYGSTEVHRLRRRVSTFQITPSSLQRTLPGSREDSVLKNVYCFYEGKKHRFEGLALYVTQHLLQGGGLDFTRGWVTPSAGDGGADFIARIQVGSGFSKTRIIVLGQAKCEKLDKPTNGRDVARTVARLKRGWIGVYVTTSYFSASVQQEIIEDQYPIVLINGLQVAKVLLDVMYLQGIDDISYLLSDIDRQYDGLVRNRRPEEVIYL